MPTAYTTLLGLALPVTGELSGQWGDEVNNYITQYLDASVAGSQVISGSQTSVTLSTTTNAALAQVGAGATGSSQYSIIRCTGNPAGTLTITAPAASKTYLVINATSTSQSVVLRGTGPTTGVTLIAGERALVAWNGSDFIKVATTAAAGGSNTQVQFNSNGVLAGSANMTFNGTRLSVADFADASLTSGRVTYAGAGGNLTDSANLTFDGTNLGVGGTGDPFGRFYGRSVGLSSASSAFLEINAATGSSSGIDFGVNAARTAGITSNTTETQFTTLTATPMLFGINGSEQMRLTSTGLGIGTSSPSRKLSVGGTTNAYMDFNATSFRRFTLGSESNGFVLYDDTAGAYRLTVDSSGNLGIGTSSPAYKLDVRGTGSQTVAVRTQTSGDPIVYLEAGGANAGFVQYSRSAQALQLSGQNPTVHATLDSSGNLGLGVTPSAWSSGFRAFEMPNGVATMAHSSSSIRYDMANVYFDGSFRYKASTGAVMQVSDGTNRQFTWNIAPSGTAGNAISFTQAMTLNSSGVLLLGTTSAAGSETLRVFNSTNSRITVDQASNGLILGADGSGPFFDTTGSNRLAFFLAGTERARITSGGDLLVGTTDSGEITGVGFKFIASTTQPISRLVINTATSTFTPITLYNTNATNNGYRFYVRADGGIGNFSANNVNLSDQRLKTDVQLAGNYLDKICAIPVKTYVYKDQGDSERTLGVLAQDVDAVAPELIDHSGFGEAPEGESPYLAVYQTDLQYALMKCIQELKAQNDDLRARVASLEAK